jgi:FMN reductase
VSRAPHVVGLGGTTRAGSSTELALRHVLFACERRGATMRLFSGAELETLPLYAP